MLSDDGPAAGSGAQPPVAQLDGRLHQPPPVSVPAAEHGQHTGWEILCPFGFSAEWNGGPRQEDIVITPDRPQHDLDHFVTSHFSRGVLTMHPQYLFRTPPGWGMMCSGSPNHVKDGIQPLVGLIETDWLPFPFTMNWIFTRPGRITFEKGEPFCFINLIEHKKVEQFQPIIRTLESNPVMKGQFEAWNRARTDFNQRLAGGDPDAVLREIEGQR